MDCIMSDILVDLKSSSNNSIIIGTWSIDIEEPNRNQIFKNFNLKIKKNVVLSLRNLKVEDFECEEQDLLALRYKEGSWNYGRDAIIGLDSLKNTFQIVFRPSAIRDCRHKQYTDSAKENIYPISFDIILYDGSPGNIYGDIISRLNVKFNIKLTRQINRPWISLNIPEPIIEFNSGLGNKVIGSLRIQNESKLHYSPSIKGKLRLEVKDDSGIDMTEAVYLEHVNEDACFDIGEIDSGESIEVPIKVNFPIIGNPSGMEKRLLIKAYYNDGNNETEVCEDILTLERNTAKPQLIVSLNQENEKIYLKNNESVGNNSEIIEFSPESDLRKTCFSFSIENGAKQGVEDIGLIVANLRGVPRVKENTKFVLCEGKTLEDILGYSCERASIFRSGESRNFNISFQQNDIVEFFTEHVNRKDFTSEIVYDVDFDYWDASTELSLYNLPESLRKHFSFQISLTLFQLPSSKWLGIDYGTSAIVCKFGDNLLNLRKKKLALFGVKQDLYEIGTNYLSSSVILRNNKREIEGLSSLLCDFKDCEIETYLSNGNSKRDNISSLFNSLAITLSPTSDQEDANNNFLLPCMKMLLGYDWIPDVGQYKGFKYLCKESEKVVSKDILYITKEGRIIPSELCRVNNVMYEVYKELFFFFVRDEITNKRLLNNIVLTVPNTFSPNHFTQLRSIIDESFKEYNLRNLKFISESDAVACYYLKYWSDINRMVERETDDRLKQEERILVYDMGAGTLDISYLVKTDDHIEVKGRMGIAKAGNYLDGVLASIISEKIPILENICNPKNITNTERLLCARMLKAIIKNEIKPKLGDTEANVVICKQDFKDIGLEEDLTINISDVIKHKEFNEYIRSCTEKVLLRFVDFYGLKNEDGKLIMDTMIISGRASKLASIYKNVEQYIKSIAQNDKFKIIEMSKVMGDKSKDAVVEGAISYAVRKGLKIKYNNIMANYGVLYYDKYGELNYVELLNPRKNKPVSISEVEGMYINQYDTEPVRCDITGCNDGEHPLRLIQSYSADTLKDWNDGNHEYITVMSEWRNIQVNESAELKIRVDENNEMSLSIDNAFTAGLAPARIDINSELNKKSMWPVFYND